MTTSSLPRPGEFAPRAMPSEAIPLGLLLIVLLGLLLRVVRLDEPLWVDELITIWQGSVPGHSLWEQFLDDLQNPLPMVVITWMRRLRDAEELLRLPSALLGALTPVLLFRAGRVVVGERAALFAALLLAVHPFHIQHSQEARGYAYLLFFGLAATDVALGAAGRLGWRRGLALLALGVASILSNLQGLFWMGGLALGLLVAGRIPVRMLPRWVVCFALMLLLTSNWWGKSLRVHESDRILPGQEVGEPLRGETTFSAFSVPYAGFLLSAGQGLGPSTRELHEREYRDGPGAMRQVVMGYLPLVAGVGGVALLLLGSGLVGARRQLPELLAWAVFTLTLALLLAIRNVKPFNPRYVMAVLPSLLLLFGAGLAWLPSRISLIVTMVWLTLLGVSITRQFMDPRYAHEDVRAAAALVTDREGADDMVLVPTVYRVFEHYYRGRSPLHNLLGPRPSSEAAVRERLESLDPDRPYLWYVRSRPWEADPHRVLLATLRADYREIARFEVPGVQMLLFDRTAAPGPAGGD